MLMDITFLHVPAGSPAAIGSAGVRVNVWVHLESAARDAGRQKSKEETVKLHPEPLIF
jgi:hypothetical protein